jgi:hypothetical protein
MRISQTGSPHNFQPRHLAAIFLFIFLFASDALAQSPPKPDKVLADYQKAIGGKKRLAQISSAKYFLRSESSDKTKALAARILVQRPNLFAFEEIGNENNIGSDAAKPSEEIQLGILGAANSRRVFSTNGISAWQKLEGESAQTLPLNEASELRLIADLFANFFLDYKKRQITSRAIAAEKFPSGDPANTIEFTNRSKAKVRCWFEQKSKLLVRLESESKKFKLDLGDYKPVNEILIAHKITFGNSDENFILENVEFRSPLAKNFFDPPVNAVDFDIKAFIEELGERQRTIDERVNEYSYKEKRTQLEYDGDGKLKKETVQIYEVFPVAGRARGVYKLISENGVPLSAERLEKETKRASEELEKIEKERAKKGGKLDEDEDPGRRFNISFFLRTSELISPRKENFRGKEAVVFDFRPRKEYKPQGSIEKIFSKLIGTAWVDPIEKTIIRLEMRFPEGFSAYGGLAKLKSDSAFSFEQIRMDDGVWLPRSSQVNAAFKALFVAGFNFNMTREFSDYKRTSTEVKDYSIEKPKP